MLGARGHQPVWRICYGTWWVLFFFNYLFKFWQKLIFRLNEVEKDEKSEKLQIKAIEMIKYDPNLIMYWK